MSIARLRWVLVTFAMMLVCSGFAQDAKQDVTKKPDPWLYPNAKADYSAQTTDVMHDTVLVTNDDLKKVLTYYLKQMGGVLAKTAEKQDDNQHDARFHESGEENGVALMRIWAEDSETPDDQQRGVKIHRFVHSTPGRVRIVVISRVANERETHIMVTSLNRS